MVSAYFVAKSRLYHRSSKNILVCSTRYLRRSVFIAENGYDRAPFRVTAIIDPAIQKHNELRLVKAREPKIRSAEDFIDKS